MESVSQTEKGVNGASANLGEKLDERISRSREEFFMELARRKRAVKRHWLEMNAVTNSYFLQLLPYRSLLDQVSRVTTARKELLLSSTSVTPYSSLDTSSMDFQATLMSPSSSESTEEPDISERVDADYDLPELEVPPSTNLRAS